MDLKRAYDSHYGISIRPNRLREWAEVAAKEFQKKFNSGPYNGEFPVLVYSGMSGIAAAVALSQKFDRKFQFGMMYVRKPYEKSHGDKIETYGFHSCHDTSKIRFVFCDDFISLGDTIIRVFKSVQAEFTVKVEPSDIITAFTGRADSYNDYIVPLSDVTSLMDRICDQLEKHAKRYVEPKLRNRARSEKIKEEAQNLADAAKISVVIAKQGVGYSSYGYSTYIEK